MASNQYTRWQRKGRPGITAVLGSLIMFTMLLTVGLGYFVFVSNSVQTTNQANQTRQALLGVQSQERLVIQETPTTAVAAATAGDVWLTILNTGSVPSTVTAVYATSSSGQPLTTSQVGALPRSHFLTGTPDLNVTMPLSIGAGASTQFMTGCAAQTGCDIAIAAGAYTYTAGSVITVSVLTADGNVFSAQFPPTVTTAVTGSTTTTIAATTTTIFAGGSGGNALVVTMAASPAQVFSGSTVTDTVDVYNYASSPVTTVAMVPNPPAGVATGTSSVTGGSCSPPSYSSIAAYSGSGTPSPAVFTCTYITHTGQVGGFLSFSGQATGTLSGSVITSAEAISNTIQVGAVVDVINQGPFSVNFFLFRMSSCTNNPAGSEPHGSFTYSSSTACGVSPSTMPPSSLSSLTDAALISGGENNYVAYYVQVTNNFNVTVPILDTSYFQTDPNQGGESDFFLVGSPTSPASTYFPNYCNVSGCGSNLLPTLTAYGGTASACAETGPSFAPPPATTCLDVAPGQTVTLTFAACLAGSSSWNWGGYQDASSFDNGSSCGNQNPPEYQPLETSYLSIIVSFVYNGQVFAQGLPFQGEVITS